MRSFRRRPTEGGIYEPNMTPLIDVSLVLVVILMVATPLAFQSGINVHAASRNGRNAALRTKSERIELDVTADGRVLVNRISVARDSMAPVLGPLIEASPTGLVVVHCSDAVPHGQFVSVIDEARQLGAKQIAVVGG
jgi:biopolymer transport protein ExbD